MCKQYHFLTMFPYLQVGCTQISKCCLSHGWVSKMNLDCDCTFSGSSTFLVQLECVTPQALDSRSLSGAQCHHCTSDHKNLSPFWTLKAAQLRRWVFQFYLDFLQLEANIVQHSCVIVTPYFWEASHDCFLFSWCSSLNSWLIVVIPAHLPPT